MGVKHKNIWGLAGSGADPQRTDLFIVSLDMPKRLYDGIPGGKPIWDEQCAFAVESFPFPARERETIPMKFMNQTNHILGAETPMGTIAIPVRHAFNRSTAYILEAWNLLTSNHMTGGTAQTTAVKTNGSFTWLVPNMDAMTRKGENPYRQHASYKLEGCLVKGLTPSEGNYTVNNQTVTLAFTLQIDRYYPESLGQFKGDSSLTPDVERAIRGIMA